MTSRDQPEADGRPPVTIQPSDLPLFYILVLVHLAVILSLPVAGWVLIRFIAGLSGSPGGLLLPALAGLVFLIEIALIWRVRRLLLRLRGVRRSP